MQKHKHLLLALLFTIFVGASSVFVVSSPALAATPAAVCYTQTQGSTVYVKDPGGCADYLKNAPKGSTVKPGFCYYYSISNASNAVTAGEVSCAAAASNGSNVSCTDKAEGCTVTAGSSSSTPIDSQAVVTNAPGVTDTPTCSDKSQTVGFNCIENKYLKPLVSVLSGIVGLAVAASIIMGGIQYSSSSGDPQRAAAGRARITKALIALIAYLFLYSFLQFIVPGGITK